MTNSPTLRATFFAIGVLLVVVTPLVAILPGPGGTFTFAGGLILMLRNSPWARRQFVRFKQRWQRTGDLADRILRRDSPRRRRERDRQRAESRIDFARPRA